MDVPAARRSLQATGRLLDRRRLAHLLGGASAQTVAAAVAAHANPDGGYARPALTVRTRVPGVTPL